METIKAVFSYTFREHVRHKVWLSATDSNAKVGKVYIEVEVLPP